jgi:hypothetical protein
MRHNPKVGQVYISSLKYRYTVTSVGMLSITVSCEQHIYTWDLWNGYLFLSDDWCLECKEKVIPGTPLDPTLPILQAGYLQDRARKKYRNI